jgi:hypothetical protein
MPKVSGEAALYVRQEAARKIRRMLNCGLWGVGMTAAMAGFLLASTFHVSSFPRLTSFLVSTAFIGLAWLVARRSTAIIEKTHFERLSMESGAAGETAVAHELAKLPTEYHVLHDIDTGYGNLDHVVIGPTGVFIIDAKNWKGVVSADSDGRLLLNGEQTVANEVNRLVRRVMGVRERLDLSGLDETPFFQCVFAFTSARVEAKWKTTGNVDCVRVDQLVDYIMDRKASRLTPRESELISTAFLNFQCRSNGSSASLRLHSKGLLRSLLKVDPSS